MSGKKVLILSGSPRKRGNTSALIEELAKGAREAGARVDTLFLHGMNIQPCTACEGCHEEGSSGCVIDDDMGAVYEALRASDSLVFATPVYWFSVSAQIKTAIDRLYAVGVGDGNVLKGKELAVLMPYADSDPFTSGAVNALRMFQDISGYLGTRMAGMVYGTAMEPGEIRNNGDLMERAHKLGEKLAGFQGL